jgi:hypothetical protein
MSERGGAKALLATVAAALAWAPACGSVTPVGNPQIPPTNPWQQATCQVTRTECIGWAEDTVHKLDNKDVNCPPSNLVSTGPFTATICYQNTAAAPTFEQQQADATNACNQYCQGGFNDLYPLGSIAGTGGPVTCQSTVTKFTAEVAGQCSKTPASMTNTGATTFALCTLGGRACNGTGTAADGTQFCTSMPPVNGGQSASGCFDSTVTTAEAMCQNMWQWKTMPANAVNKLDEFHFVSVEQVELTASEHDCNDIASNVGPQAYGIDAGPVASLTTQGTTTSLRAKAGFAKVGRVCDSESEFCSTILTSMKVQLQDVTISGLTVHNPEATLVAPATTDFATGKLPVNSVKLNIEGDITAVGRFRTVFSNDQPLTISTTATTASLSGPFSGTIKTSAAGIGSVSGSISFTASTTSPNSACADETALQQLLGFETTADWTSSQVPLALTSTQHTQGCFGMQVGGGNYRSLNSVPFATPLPGTTGTLALDFFNPPNPPNLFWLGAVQMYLSCPSANFNNQYIGQVELTGRPLNKFSTLSFPIPGPVLSILQGSHPDCFFSIAVNSNATPTPPVIDNLRFK